MSTPLLNDRDVQFMLYEFLNTEELLSRPRYRQHSRDAFDETLINAKTIAESYFANHRVKSDAIPPSFDGEKVTITPEIHDAWKAFSEAGYFTAHYDTVDGGMQLPDTLIRLVMSYFSAANTGTSGYMLLAISAANLIRNFGSEEQKARFLPPLLDGRATGTMVMTEAKQGSALADISTYAVPREDGSYRIYGEKIYISAGDTDIADNVIHLVLAKIEGAPAGVGGISLFICPKILLNDDGSPGERNDVKLKGLLDKMGCRNYICTQMSFGGESGAIGYLIGEPHKGLKYMFQMLNESRINVGIWGAALGYQSYNAALGHARERIQGRLPSDKNPESTQIRIIEHADVRRMLLAQKAYSEGGLALCMFASSLFEDSRTAETEQARADAFTLLDLITPVVKSWPAKYGLKANEYAIQIYGGAGYIRTNEIEQYYRDNRINPIHEGTDAIQGLDILARKVPQNKMAGYKMLCARVAETINAARVDEHLVTLADALEEAMASLDDTTNLLLEAVRKDVDLALANATLYLDVFGRVMMSWIWLRQALLSSRALADNCLEASEASFYKGKLQAARYYIEWELPEIKPQIEVLNSVSPVCYDMQEEWFQQ